METINDTKPLLIIDGYGFIFRAYHVQPPLTSPAGIPVGAIYGFTAMLIKLISDFRPEYAVIALDHGGKNFRHTIYKEYKANRSSTPNDLITQLNLVQPTADALNFINMSKERFEADDLIATLATKATSIKRNTIIISSDKDLMQLVNKYVKMYDPAKSKYITNDDIIAKFGVPASKVREVQALIGDKSDNIPGVAGFGPKTASQLINQFGNLQNLLTSIDQVKSPRQQELLTKHKEDALISWQLVGLNHNVNIDKNIEKFYWTPPPEKQISNFLNEFGFKSLNKRVENLFHVKIQESPQITPSTLQKTEQNSKVIDIHNKNQLNMLTREIRKVGHFAIAIVNNDETKLKLALSTGNDTYFIPYDVQIDTTLDLFSYKNSKPTTSKFNSQINELFKDKSIKKITYDLKKFLKLCNCPPSSFEDLQIMDYILSTGQKAKKLMDIVTVYTEYTIDKKQNDSIQLVKYFFECYTKQEQELVTNKMLHLYRKIDLPLCYILHKMEKAGVKINIKYLKKLSLEFAKRISDLEKQIYKITGEEFNIISPKQLGKILFTKMELPFAKTTGKTKSYSTSADILEKLDKEGHEIASMILEYRHLTKLKNTYTDTLLKQADPRTKKIHSTFLQTATSTGRLSSVNPNAQNVPIRSKEGNKIRAAFVASAGNKLISADYSQIELRILSHVANIDSLKKAFEKNRDIHAQTASQIFGLPPDQITPDMRRKSKAINYGIVYGISSFGLARELNVPRKEAADYIEKYFKQYPEIQKYMCKTINFAKKNGFIQNIAGRKCFIPNINNKNYAIRTSGERAAINAPMQSLTADIVKMAMVALDQELISQTMKTKMILQIHDELIFEAPEEEVNSALKLIKSIMEKAIHLDVKIKVDVLAGNNWQKIH